MTGAPRPWHGPCEETPAGDASRCRTEEARMKTRLNLATRPIPRESPYGAEE
jgi:hypothetical protein